MKTLFTLMISSVLVLFSCHQDDGLYSIKSIDSGFSLGDTLLKVMESPVIEKPNYDLSLTYEWDFGDGFTTSGKNPVHSYLTPGNYTIKLTVSDNSGHSSSTLQHVKVGEFYAYEIVINSLDKNSGYPDYTSWTSSDIFIILNQYNGPVLFKSGITNFNNTPVSIPVPDVKLRFQNESVETEISVNHQEGSVPEQVFSNLWSGADLRNSIYDHTTHSGSFTYAFQSNNSYTVNYKIK